MKSNARIEIPGECGVFLIGGERWADRLRRALGVDVVALDPGVDTADLTRTIEGADDEVGCVVVQGRHEIDWNAVVAGARDDRDDRPVFVTVAPGREPLIERVLEAGVTDVIRTDIDGWESVFLHRIDECLVGDRRPGLRSRQHYLVEAFDNVTDQIFHLDTERRYVALNESAKRAFLDRHGLTADDILGRPIDEVFPEIVETGFYERLVETMRTGEPTTVVERVPESRLPDRTVWLEYRWFPSKAGVTAYVRDVTEEVIRERRLEHDEAIVKAVSDGIYTIDDAGRITSVNHAFASMTGYDEAELLGMDATTFLDVGDDEGAPDEPWVESTSLTVRPPDGESFPAEQRVERLPGDGAEAGYVGVIRDVSERERFERELERRNKRLRSVLDNAPIVLYALDAAGNYTLSTGKGLNALDREPGALVGENVFDYYADHDQIVDDCRRVLDGEEVHSTVEIGDLVFSNHYLPVVEDGAVDGAIGVSVDVTDRVHYERTLRALHRATRELTDVQTPEAVAQLVVDTARDVLDLSGVAVFLFDEELGSLRLAATVLESDLQTDGDIPQVIEPGRGHTWQTFVDGQTAIYDDINRAPDASDPSSSVRSGLFIPLGDHGVLAAGSNERDTFDRDTVELAELLAAGAEATLERVDRESELRERDEQLKAHNEALTQLDRVNEILREVHGAIVRAHSREAIERAVAERLTMADRFGYAWIGSIDSATDRIERVAEAGDAAGYLDELAIEATATEREPTGIAASTGAVAVVENVADDIGSESWRRAALARGFQSVVSVPLEYGEHRYGVLTVYATRPDAFAGEVPDVLGELGKTIGYAINAVERTSAIATDAVVVLEYALGERNCAGCRLARETGSVLELVGMLPGSDGIPGALYSVSGASPDRVVSAAESKVAIDSAAVLATDDDGGVIRITFSMPPLPSLVAEYGGEVITFRADSDEARVEIEVPVSRDVRPVTDLVEATFPDAELLAKYERTRADRSGFEQLSSVFDSLTTRQKEVLEVAFHGGYFDSPRAATGAELAEALDLSPAMFHRHLRAIEHRIFESMLE